jgi:hypothetical protein
MRPSLMMQTYHSGALLAHAGRTPLPDLGLLRLLLRDTLVHDLRVLVL